MLDERGLHGMQVAHAAQPFDGGDVRTLMHDRKGQAGVYPRAIGNDRTRAALAMVAALFRTGKVQMVAQGVQQGSAGVQFQGV